MAKKEQADSFDLLCDRVDRLSNIYANDPYWQIMKEGCDAVRNNNVTDELKERVEKERGCWGAAAASNKKALSLLLDQM